MPGPLDLALLAVFAVAWPLYSMLVDWPRYLARLRAGVPGARMRQYVSTLVEQWTLAALAIVLWVRAARPWAPLGLRVPSGWGAWLGLILIVATVALFVHQLRIVAGRPDVRARLRIRFTDLDPVLPHTPLEFRTFLALSVTAGICEELLFRGFLIWALRPWLGWWGAALLGAGIFGLAHAYQGRKGIVRASIAGLAITLVYALTGSLLPCMALHVIVDIGGGWTTWLVLREASAPLPATA